MLSRFSDPFFGGSTFDVGLPGFGLGPSMVDDLFTPGAFFDFQTPRTPTRQRPIDLEAYRDIGSVGTRRFPNQLWVDVYEDDAAYRVSADVPGVTKEDVQLNLAQDGRVLNVVVHRRMPERKENEDWRRHERDYGRFVRSLRIPRDVNPDKLAARLENGILEITIPKIEPQKRLSMQGAQQQPQMLTQPQQQPLSQGTAGLGQERFGQEKFGQSQLGQSQFGGQGQPTSVPISTAGSGSGAGFSGYKQSAPQQGGFGGGGEFTGLSGQQSELGAQQSTGREIPVGQTGFTGQQSGVGVTSGQSGRDIPVELGSTPSSGGM